MIEAMRESFMYMLSGVYSWIGLGKGGDREKPGFPYAKSKNFPLSTIIAPP